MNGLVKVWIVTAFAGAACGAVAALLNLSSLVVGILSIASLFLIVWVMKPPEALGLPRHRESGGPGGA